MRFLGYFGDDLHIKNDTTFVPGNLRQQAVIKPFSPAEPATGKIERYSRHKHQVQMV